MRKTRCCCEGCVCVNNGEWLKSIKIEHVVVINSIRNFFIAFAKNEASPLFACMVGRKASSAKNIELNVFFNSSDKIQQALFLSPLAAQKRQISQALVRRFGVMPPQSRCHWSELCSEVQIGDIHAKVCFSCLNTVCSSDNQRGDAFSSPLSSITIFFIQDVHSHCSHCSHRKNLYHN